VHWTCVAACSRRVKELQERGRKDVTLHCNELGNYEELQCDDGVCWCAEEKTGTPFSRILPENMMTMLPCCEFCQLYLALRKLYQHSKHTFWMLGSYYLINSERQFPHKESQCEYIE
jgi:hypothetical protein